jgi:hypothetical protein
MSNETNKTKGEKPKVKPPPMMLVNGMGFRLRGSRHNDQATGEYETTLYFYFLWMPLFALRGYRVLDSAEGGWFFVDRTSLSGDDKIYNASVGPLLTITLAVLIYFVKKS